MCAFAVDVLIFDGVLPDQAVALRCGAQGVDLRHYSRQIEKDLSAVEEESILDCAYPLRLCPLPALRRFDAAIARFPLPRPHSRLLPAVSRRRP